GLNSRGVVVSSSLARRDVAGRLGGFAQSVEMRLRLGAAGADAVGERLDQGVERGIARETENVPQPVGLAPRHDFVAAVVAVATNRDACVRPGLVVTSVPKVPIWKVCYINMLWHASRHNILI